ncbi:hypothetical protein SNEBB_000259 [Seison nebaliae]|nr:hypothetical protein SNEBB_000259 [Seison nebaliae]
MLSKAISRSSRLTNDSNILNRKVASKEAVRDKTAILIDDAIMMNEFLLPFEQTQLSLRTHLKKLCFIPTSFFVEYIFCEGNSVDYIPARRKYLFYVASLVEDILNDDKPFKKKMEIIPPIKTLNSTQAIKEHKKYIVRYVKERVLDCFYDVPFETYNWYPSRSALMRQASSIKPFLRLSDDATTIGFRPEDRSGDSNDLDMGELDRGQHEFNITDTVASWRALAYDRPHEPPKTVHMSSEDNKNLLVTSFESASHIFPEHGITYVVETHQAANDAFCSYCVDTIEGELIYPCRICNRVYHLPCLKSIGMISSDVDEFLVKQAYSNIGWSCPICNDLSKLIPEEDVIELMEQFESCEKDESGGISWTEFLRMRSEEHRKRFGNEMTQDDVEAAWIRFQLVDIDGSGTMDWGEFISYECMRRLYKKNRLDLVKALSEKEIQGARETFFVFDRDRGGTISDEEARRAYRHWFNLLHGKEKSNTDAVETHVKVHTDLVMDAAPRLGAEVSWDDFLMQQSIYILASRPNNPLGLIPDATGMIIPLQKRSKGIQ